MRWNRLVGELAADLQNDWPRGFHDREDFITDADERVDRRT